MVYLERDVRLLSEIRGDRQIKRGALRAENTSTVFHSAGSYRSKELGEEVFVGLKGRKDKDSGLVLARFVFELAVMSVVAQNMPHLLPELPLFYGLLVDKKGEPLAIVTEDFSENGKNSVKPSEDTPEGLRDLFIKGTIDEDHFHPAFKVSPLGLNDPSKSRKRLGDFYPLLSGCRGVRNIHREHFPEEQIEKNLERYTIKIQHKL